MIWRAQIQEQPQHQHDSKSCIFMGTYEGCDLWFNPIEKSFISRFGKDDKYKCVTSDLVDFILKNSQVTHFTILEAIKRAKIIKVI